MAYASLVSLQKTTQLILNHDKCSISDDDREVITSIREYAVFLMSVLENSSEKANSLEGKIRDLANEAEDLIECSMGSQFRMNWSSVGLSRVEVENLESVREEIGSVAGSVMDGGLCDLPAAISSSSVADTRQNDDVVMGLEDDLLAIKGRLCGESSKLEVIPIVGMGGIGKTTLARNAYDDPLVMEYFDICVFVQVSQDYSAKKFLLNVLASIELLKEEMSGDENESRIAEKVYKTLKGRRYLIVMDDIWSTKVLDDVRNIFPDDMNGSRIMLTTRLSDVAAYASSGSSSYVLTFMDGDKSWNLLKRKVFADGQDCPPELEHIGRAIAEGCRGLPLAVVLVAGILSTVVKTRASWEKISENVNSVVEEELEKILSLSYSHLPHHLRPCFLFMGGFPEDYIISISRLIKIWVAEGFLKHQNEYKTLEEEAEECLEDLVKRSLVLVTSRKSNGRIKCCSLHDLVREMCIRKAQEEKFILTDRYVFPEITIEGRRISIGHSRLKEIWGPTIHTILCFQTIHDCSLLAFLQNFKLLRVFDVITSLSSASLPLEIFELFHLRYLALSHSNIIPAAISKLENLETLIIRSYGRFGSASYLPQEIWSMPRLRHLVLTKCYMLRDPPVRPTLPLENLQTLSGIASFLCSERILKLIPNLKKLGIVYSTNEGQHDLHSLVNLHQLEKLKITALNQRFSSQGQYLAFPRTLKKLTLDGGELPWKDMIVVGSLPDLQVLKLKNNACSGSTWETTDGEFPQLNFMQIECSNLKNWTTESDTFPRLKHLWLGNCWSLTEIPDSIGEIQTLEVIQVFEIEPNESLRKSIKQIQENQWSYGNEDLQVRCITLKQMATDAVSRVLKKELTDLASLVVKEEIDRIVGLKWELEEENKAKAANAVDSVNSAQTGLRTMQLDRKFMKRSNLARMRSK